MQINLPENAVVSYRVYDLLGRQVIKHEAGTMAAGQTVLLELDGSRLPSGLYQVIVVAETASRRMTTRGSIVKVR